jgi:serpin B
MMTQKHEFAYAERDGFAALSLPLSAHQLRFLIILPKKLDGLASVEKRLSSDVIGGELEWERRDVTLHLPKFKLEPPMLSLTSVLQTLGMKSAFDIPLGSANFERIAPRRPNDYLFISGVFALIKHSVFRNPDHLCLNIGTFTRLWDWVSRNKPGPGWQ